MKITFVGHASVLLEECGVGLLIDPWLKGEAFNDSWTLYPQSVLRSEDLSRSRTFHAYAVSSGKLDRARVSRISIFIVSGGRATSCSMVRAAMRPTPLVLRRLKRKANSSR